MLGYFRKIVAAFRSGDYLAALAAFGELLGFAGQQPQGLRDDTVPVGHARAFAGDPIVALENAVKLEDEGKEAAFSLEGGFLKKLFDEILAAFTAKFKAMSDPNVGAKQLRGEQPRAAKQPASGPGSLPKSARQAQAQRKKKKK